MLAAGLTLTACGQKELKPWTKGGFETGKYRNVFAEMGYPKKDIDAKLESIFQEVFYGPDKVYFEVGVTLLGMSIQGKEVQPAKAMSPIYVRLLGSVTAERAKQWRKVLSFIAVMPSGISI